MKKLAMMVVIGVMGFALIPSGQVATPEKAEKVATVEKVAEVVGNATVETATPVKVAEGGNNTTECGHEWVEDSFTTDWGLYEGLICTKCGEGEYWLTEQYETPEEVAEVEEVAEPEEVEEVATPDGYDWETYEKPNADKPGFNAGEVETDHLYNEEYFYNDYYDHSNVDLVYDEEIANSYPPYKEGSAKNE